MFFRGKGINRQKQTIGGVDYRKLTVKERGGHQNTTESKGVSDKIKLWHNQTPSTPCKAINDDQSLNS